MGSGTASKTSAHRRTGAEAAEQLAWEEYPTEVDTA